MDEFGKVSKKIIHLFIFCAVVTVALVGFGIAAKIISNKTQDRIDNHVGTIISTQDLLNLVVSADSRYRGILLSADPTLMERWLVTRDQITEKFAELESLCAAKPDQLQRLAQLKTMVNERVAMMQVSLDGERRFNGHLLTEIRASLDEVMAAERRALTSAVEADERADNGVLASLVATGVLLLGLSFLCTRLNHSVIAELRDKSEILKRSVAQFATTTDLANVGVSDWNLVTGECIWNPKHYEMFGFSRWDGVPTMEDVLSRIHPDDQATARRNLGEIETRGGTFRTQFRVLVPPEGTVRWMEVSGRCLNEGDRPARVISVVLDITERRRMEESLHRTQKMEALGQLTGGVAHDVNNVLGIVSANLQLMEYNSDPANVAECRASASAAVQRGTDLIKRLLGFARWRAETTTSCDVAAKVKEVTPLLMKAMPPRLRLDVSIPVDLWFARMEPTGFGDALINLILNAAQATVEKGSVIALDAKNVVIDPEIELHGVDLVPGDYVRVSVSDDGEGIAADVLPRVFEPFFTTRSRGDGTGLGLSTVYGYCRRCGGTATIYSEEGRGTTVRLYLPRESHPAASEMPPAPRKAIAGQGQTILIVDDERGLLYAASRYLEGLNYRVLTAESATIAHGIAMKERIDLLFSDMIMPGGVTGADLADALRRVNPELRVLLTSGFTNADQWGRIQPGYMVLQKPYRLEELARKLHEVLNEGRAATTSTV